MCQICLDSLKEIFPEVPENERTDFLTETTCFPFGTCEQTRQQLLDNRASMATTDYHECYTIAEKDIDEGMKGWQEDAVGPMPPANPALAK